MSSLDRYRAAAERHLDRRDDQIAQYAPQPKAVEPPPVVDVPIMQNPVSFTGAAKRIIPGRTSYSWPVAALLWVCAILVLVVAWAGVLVWYALLTVTLGLGWWLWAGWTLNRRHHIHDRIRANMPQRVM